MNTVYGMKCGAPHGSSIDVFFFAADPVTGEPVHNKIVASDLRSSRSRWQGRYHILINNENYTVKWLDTKWNYLRHA